MNQLSETQKAYLAGFVDADGCIYITKNHKDCYHLGVNVSQSDKRPLDRFCEIVGLGNVSIKNKANGNNRTSYQWRMYGRTASIFLETIFDYLMVKQDQAYIAIKFQTTASWKGEYNTSALKQRETYYHKLKNLKRWKSRGNSHTDEYGKGNVQQLAFMADNTALCLFHKDETKKETGNYPVSFCFSSTSRLMPSDTFPNPYSFRNWAWASVMLTDRLTVFSFSLMGGLPSLFMTLPFRTCRSAVSAVA